LRQFARTSPSTPVGHGHVQMKHTLRNPGHCDYGVLLLLSGGG
jgi:hypothetical protein